MNPIQHSGSLGGKIASKFRLPEIRTPAEFDAASHLSAEETALGKTLLKKIPDSDGWAILGNDPELQALWAIMERQYMAFFESFQGVPLSQMNLITLIAARHAGSDYVFGLLAALTVRQIAAYKMPLDYGAKLAVLDSPDSVLWTEQERLVLQFTWASLQNRMTDELFAQARAAWGEKTLLRSLAWASYVSMWGMVANTLNMKFHADMIPPGFAIPPEAVSGMLPFVQATRMQMRAFVQDTLSDFPGR